jgi:hypothetical protein
MKQDHDEIIGYLAEIANAGIITQAAVAENNKMLHSVMYNMQHVRTVWKVVLARIIITPLRS